MAFNNEIEKTKKEIEVLTAKLALLEEMETHKTPCEIAYKNWWGEYPSNTWNCDITRWEAFKMGYNAAYEEKVSEEPEKEPVSLYKRFVNEGAYGMTSFENALKVVNEFLMDEGVIEDESGEYITFTLQKSLLEVTND